MLNPSAVEITFDEVISTAEGFSINPLVFWLLENLLTIIN